jgi:uncharacterized protein (TIGR02145 family)
MTKTKFPSLTASLVLATTLTLSCEDKEKDKPATAAETASTAEAATAETATPNTPPTFTDSRDGKTYKKVTIGTQTWMAENMSFAANSSVCYDNKPENCAKYGRLYDWNTAKQACPAGWHLPSDSEWETLANQVGSNAGEKLKSKSWGGTDAYDFTALPGGMNAGGKHSGEGSMGLWWSSTGHDVKNALRYIMDGSHGKMEKFHNEKTRMLSVRCVENSEEYLAEAAAKSKALEDLIIKVIKANSNEDELNKLIAKDLGIAYYYTPGMYKNIYRFDKISYKDRESEYGPPYGLYCATDNYKIRFEKLPKYDGCPDDGGKWNKPPGIYCDTTYAAAESTNEMISHEVNVISKDGGACIFYVAFWQNKWYLIAIDQFDPCSA